MYNIIYDDVVLISNGCNGLSTFNSKTIRKFGPQPTSCIVSVKLLVSAVIGNFCSTLAQLTELIIISYSDAVCLCVCACVCMSGC